MPIAIAWIFAFFVGAIVIATIGGLVIWIREDPEVAPYFIAFFIGSVIVGWLLANWFGWWDAWLYG